MKTKHHLTRLLCAQIVSIRRSETVGSKPYEALLEEIGPDSAALSLELPLKKGTEIVIDCKTCELRGTVENCLPWLNGYMIEVGFPDGQDWNPAVFMPRRLFNPASMVCEREGCRPDCVRTECLYRVEPQWNPAMEKAHQPSDKVAK